MSKITLDFDKDIVPPKSNSVIRNPVRALISQAMDQLPIDLSYHVPATKEVPEPHKFYSHMVIAENTKFVKKAMDGEKGEIKHFVLKAVDASDKRGVGARLFRVANLTKTDAERRAQSSAASAETRATNKAKKEELARQAEAAQETKNDFSEERKQDAEAFA